MLLYNKRFGLLNNSQMCLSAGSKIKEIVIGNAQNWQYSKSNIWIAKKADREQLIKHHVSDMCSQKHFWLCTKSDNVRYGPIFSSVCRKKVFTVTRWTGPWDNRISTNIYFKLWQICRHKSEEPVEKRNQLPGIVVHACNPMREDLGLSPDLQTRQAAHTYNPQHWGGRGKKIRYWAILSCGEFIVPSNRPIRISWGSLKPSMGHITLHPSVTKALSPSLFGPL